jgi:hypothetical protein
MPNGVSQDVLAPSPIATSLQRWLQAAGLGEAVVGDVDASSAAAAIIKLAMQSSMVEPIVEGNNDKQLPFALE